MNRVPPILADHKNSNAIVKCHKKREQKKNHFHSFNTFRNHVRKRFLNKIDVCILTWHAFFQFYYLHSFAPSLCSRFLSILEDCSFFLNVSEIKLNKNIVQIWLITLNTEQSIGATGVWDKKKPKVKQFQQQSSFGLDSKSRVLCSVCRFSIVIICKWNPLFVRRSTKWLMRIVKIE